MENSKLHSLIIEKSSIIMGISLIDTKGMCRKSDVVLTRYAIWSRFKEMGLTLQEIGSYFNKHHSTVIHGIRLYEEGVMVKDPAILRVKNKLDAVLYAQ